MHHHDHTWHRTAEAGGENSSTATASDLQQHLDQGLLSSSSSRSRQRSSPGSNSLSFPVSLLQLPCVFSKQLLYMPIRILETLAREIGDRTVSVRSIHNDRKDNLVCFFFDSFTSLTLPFSELLFENPAKNDVSCRHQTLAIIRRGQKHESLSSKSAFSTFFKRVERP